MFSNYYFLLIDNNKSVINIKDYTRSYTSFRIYVSNKNDKHI